ncbi:MAG: 50S ribosomal protein L32e [Candidatus Aenigmarchaeota archaeon]|nr:50S ribosomal protein L32e [Candidatus Aenigmarchaeota archaeon]
MRNQTGLKKQLKQRKAKKRRKPYFSRQELHAQKTLGDVWRRPRGIDSKLRKKRRARGRLPSPGWGGPASARGLTRGGMRPVMVFNVHGIRELDKQKDIAVIGGSVGRKKKFEIIKAAEDSGVQVFNARKK